MEGHFCLLLTCLLNAQYLLWSSLACRLILSGGVLIMLRRSGPDVPTTRTSSQNERRGDVFLAVSQTALLFDNLPDSTDESFL